MIFQVISIKKKKKGLHPCDPRFLRDFQGDLRKKKKGLRSSDPSVFANFRVVFTNEQNTGTLPPTGRDMALKPGRMVSLP